MNALKIAVNRFIDQVYNKALGPDGLRNTEDDIDHRIAVVKFAGSKTDAYGNDTYREGRFTYNYSQIVNGLVPVLNSSAKANVNALTAGGATSVDYGMEHALSLINGIEAGRESNRVVIMFTDGEPNHHDGFDSDIADNAIATSREIKASGATVYTVGIFSGANDTVPMPNNANNTNKYMHYVSSNFKDAQSLSNGGTATYPTDGTSYYLAADNATKLNDIFYSISQNIQTGGASMTLGTETEVRDIVSPYFTMPENAESVSVYTAEYTGRDADGNRTFAKKVEFSDANVAIDQETKAVSVTNFDFSSDANCVTDTNTNSVVSYSGRKLIIEFTVKPVDGFLGGNSVPTNGEASGVYKDGNVVENFPVPTVDIPIKYEIGSQNQSIYLGNTADLEKLYVQDTKLDGKNNAYVDITYHLYDTSHTDSEGNQTLLATMTIKAGQTTGTWVWEEGADMTPALTADNKYAISCTVKPIYDGTYEEKETDNQAPEVYVFKPEVTFKDSEIFLGETADYAYNTPDNNVTWKHNGDVANADIMGPAPELSYTYNPEVGAFTEDTDVNVTVWIGDNDVTRYTSFVNTDDPDAKDHQFTVKVKSGTLTIKKAGNVDQKEGFIFNVYVDGKLYTTVSVKGNGTVTLSGLPAGTYSVTEDTGWSWRYQSSVSDPVTLSKDSATGDITVTNTKDNNKWLGGEAYVRNVSKTESTQG